MGLKLYFFDFEPRIGLTKPSISDRFTHIRPRMRETGTGEHRPGRLRPDRAGLRRGTGARRPRQRLFRRHRSREPPPRTGLTIVPSRRARPRTGAATAVTRFARPLASARQPFSIQHSAFSITRATRGQWHAPGSHSAFSTQHSALPARRAGRGERPAAIQHSALSIQHSESPPPRDHPASVWGAPEEFDESKIFHPPSCRCLRSRDAAVNPSFRSRLPSGDNRKSAAFFLDQDLDFGRKPFESFQTKGRKSEEPTMS